MHIYIHTYTHILIYTQSYFPLTDAKDWSEKDEKTTRYGSLGVSFEEAEAEKARVANTRKVINHSLLFGSKKPSGMLDKKYNYSGAKFSHTRIFGEAKKASSKAGAK